MLTKGWFLTLAAEAGVVQFTTERMSPLEATYSFVHYHSGAPARFVCREGTYTFVWPQGQEKYIEHRGKGDIPNGGWFTPEDPTAFETFCRQHGVEIISA